MRFRKKPVVIEAIQWRGDNLQELKNWGAPVVTDENGLRIITLEDGPHSQVKHYASLQDWIIKGVQGEFYACKPDIFADTYEPTVDGQ